MMDSRLLQAIWNNDLQALRSCLLEYQSEGNIFEQRDEQCNTILHLAVQLGKTEMVTEIVRLKPELLEAENEKQETPLHEACRQIRNLEIVTLLLDSNPNAALKLNNENQSIFSVACSHGFVEAVELMLDRPWLMEFEGTALDSVPLHLALPRGYTDLVKKVLQVRPTLAAKTNHHGSSLMHYASSLGEVEIIKMLLSLDPLLSLKHDKDGYTPVHLAVICGLLKVVEEFISTSPASFQLSTLKDGDTVFHLAAKFNRFEIFKLLLRKDYYVSSLLHRPNRSGDTVLHAAVSRGNYQLAQYIMYSRNWVVSVNFKNHSGQTVLDILNHVEDAPETYDLIGMIKRKGGKTSDELIHQREEAIQLISTEEAATQQQQRSEQQLTDGLLSTRLDAQNQDNNNDSNNQARDQHLPAATVTATSSRVEEKPEEVDEENDDSSHQDHEFSWPETVASSPHREKYSSLKTEANKHGKRLKIKAQLQQSEQQLTDGIPGSRLGQHLPARIMATNSRVEEKPEEVDDERDNSSQDDEFSSSNTVASPSHRDKYSSPKTNANKDRPKRLKKNGQQYLRRQSMMRQKKLIEIQNPRRDRHHEMYKEALQNTRNTITVVAILVATVSLAAGLSPPGGVYQDGPYRGMSVAGRTTAFRVFVVSNNIALFISLCIVIVLVSIVPFRRKPLMRLLVFAHRAVWVALAFMATAYVAAAWITVPHDHQERWMFVALISTCGATLGTAFIGLTVKLVEHRLRKSKWRKEQRNRDEEQKKRGKEAAELRAERIISFQREEEILELRQEGIVSLEREKEIADGKVERIISFDSDYESSHHLGYLSVG